MFWGSILSGAGGHTYGAAGIWHAGDVSLEELRGYLHVVGVDFISPHRPRDAASPAQTESKTRQYHALLKELGPVVPVHYQEPFRRGFG